MKQPTTTPGAKRSSVTDLVVRYLDASPNKSEVIWRHLAAGALHGWAQHQYHEGVPIELEDADYEAALEAASHPMADGTYAPHLPALSKHAPRAVKE